MSMAVSTMATCTRRGPQASRSRLAIRWAAPESPITRPTMAPSPMVSIVSPIWPPIPSARTSEIFSRGMPWTRATPTATRSRAAKPLSLNFVISRSRTSTLIPTTTSGMRQFSFEPPAGSARFTPSNRIPV